MGASGVVYGTGQVQPLDAIGPECLEHSIRKVTGSHRDERPIDERSEKVDDLVLIEALKIGPRACATSVVDIERAGEHGHPLKQNPLTLVEQVIGPVHRRPQRLVPLNDRTPPAS